MRCREWTRARPQGEAPEAHADTRSGDESVDSLSRRTSWLDGWLEKGLYKPFYSASRPLDDPPRGG